MSVMQAMAIAIAVSLLVSTALPDAGVLATLDAGQIARNVLSSVLFGAFLALGGIGLRMATLRMPLRT